MKKLLTVCILSAFIALTQSGPAICDTFNSAQSTITAGMRGVGSAFLPSNRVGTWEYEYQKLNGSGIMIHIPWTGVSIAPFRTVDYTTSMPLTHRNDLSAMLPGGTTDIAYWPSYGKWFHLLSLNFGPIMNPKGGQTGVQAPIMLSVSTLVRGLGISETGLNLGRIGPLLAVLKTGIGGSLLTTQDSVIFPIVGSVNLQLVPIR